MIESSDISVWIFISLDKNRFLEYDIFHIQHSENCLVTTPDELHTSFRIVGKNLRLPNVNVCPGINSFTVHTFKSSMLITEDYCLNSIGCTGYICTLASRSFRLAISIINPWAVHATAFYAG